MSSKGRVEDVLLSVDQVRHKKNDGTLYVMKERIAFFVDGRDSASQLSHNFGDIKMQKISPEGKAKVQLQIVMHDGNNSTFHFVNKQGLAQQLQDRENVKELIQSILPNFKRKVDTELERKNKLLSNNPKLLQLYKDLVISKVLTSEEFWAIHEKELSQSVGDSATKQDLGISGAFLSEIKPVTDGCNGFKYNLTAEIIESVFKAYPAVKKKYIESVPAKLSESEFWTKFFQSHYFHRDRVTTGMKDIFSECGKMDDNLLKRDIKRNLNDPLLSLGRFGDNTIEEGFCSSTSNDPKEVTDGSSTNSSNIVHQSIIKRFNQHSFLVLKTCNNTQTEAEIHNDMLSDKKRKNPQDIDDAKRKETDEVVDDNNIHKRQRIAEKIHFDDLSTDHDAEKKKSSEKGLNLEKLEKFLFNSSNPTTEKQHKSTANRNNNSLENTDQSFRYLTDDWNQRTTHKQLINPSTAVNALGELSPGGILMRGYQDHNLMNFVSPDVEDEVRHLYLSAGELLKEFWTAFPPINAELENKAIRMHETLRRFYSSKLKVFEDKIAREMSPVACQMLLHINSLLDTAFKKFQRRIKRD